MISYCSPATVLQGLAPLVAEVLYEDYQCTVHHETDGRGRFPSLVFDSLHSLRNYRRTTRVSRLLRSQDVDSYAGT
jgi:hypothetical protein